MKTFAVFGNLLNLSKASIVKEKVRSMIAVLSKVLQAGLRIAATNNKEKNNILKFHLIGSEYKQILVGDQSRSSFLTRCTSFTDGSYNIKCFRPEQ